MIFRFIIFSLLIFVFSCSQNPTRVNVPKKPETKVVDSKECPKVSKGKRFSYRSSLKYIKQVSDVSNCIASNQAFINEICAIKSFDYSSHSGIQVANKILAPSEAVISTYRTRNPFSKVIATTYLGRPEIYFNTRKNPRSLKAMINTAMHERMHVLGYGHGNNNSYGKQNSVPYKIGSIAEKFVKNCE